MDLNQRQQEIIDIVKENQPITGDEIARLLNISRATIRPDLTILTMLEILGARPKLGYFFKGKPKFGYFSDKIKNTLVEEVMSVPVVIDEESSIYDAIVTIFLENVGSIFITRDGNLIGVVSRKDLLRSTLGKISLDTTPVSVIMTRMPNVIYVDPKDCILNAVLKIYEHNIDSVAVVSKNLDTKENLTVVGRFTKTNITDFFVDLSKESY